MFSSNTAISNGVGNGDGEMAMGVKLSSRPVTTFSERDGKSREQKVADNVIQEAPWTLNNMLERFAFQRTLPWVTGDVSHTVLARIRIPQDLLTTSISAAPFDRFVYWRGDVELNFQVTSTPLTQGMAVAVFVPLSAERFIDSTIVPNFSNVSLNQAVYLYANTNTAARMLISYNSPQAYLDLTQDVITTRNALGYVYVVVFNRIQLAATASDTTSISYFSRFLNNNFKVPRISAAVTARPQAMSMLASAATSVLTQHKTPPKSGQKSVLRSIADKLIPKGLIGDVIDGAMGIFGLDKPTDPNLQLPLQVLGTQRMNFAQGIESIDKMSLYPAQTYESTEETFATSIDEMDFNFLKKKYTYLGTFTFSTDSPVGSTIASWPISPMPMEFFNQQVTQVPLLSYISIPFQYWRGGITYKFQVVATSFQTGKLFFAVNFNTYQPQPLVGPGLGIGPLTSQYGQAYELNQGSNEVELTVPFVANTPYLDVPNSNIPSLEDTVGYVNVVVINPLVAPNNTPLSIEVNVHIAGADDFELSTLTSSNNLVPSQPLQLALLEDDFEVVALNRRNALRFATARPQSSVAPMNISTNEVNIAEENLVAPNVSTEERTDVTQFGPLSVKNLLKKYQMIPLRAFNMPSADQNGVMMVIPISSLFGAPHVSATPAVQEDYKPVLGLWTHFQPLYRQFKGPLRFKMMLDELTPNFAFSWFYAPPVVRNPGTSTEADSYGNSLYMPDQNVGVIPTWNGRGYPTRVRNLTRLPITYVNGVQKTAEFEVPFTSKFMSIISWTGASAENELVSSPLIDLGSLVFYTSFIPGDFTTSPVMKLFMSIGDETRLGNLFQIPQVAVNNTTNAIGVLQDSVWPDSYGTGAPPSTTLGRL